MVTINGISGVSMVQDNTITSAKIVDASVAGADLLTSSGIGYKTGDGGSVTQLTSKSTAVTLNKPCGQITMNNAALVAGGIVGFQLLNSNIAVTDILAVNLKSGFATNYSYRVWAEEAAAGGIKVVLENRTAGSLSEAIVINFAIIKSAGV